VGDLTKFLWTGESEYCICGNHVTDHETFSCPLGSRTKTCCGNHVTDHETLQSSISLTQHPVVICRGSNKARIIQGCHCDEFRPYRRLVGEEDYEDEVIEKQIRMEVKQE
jgi:hypothetical protein